MKDDLNELDPTTRLLTGLEKEVMYDSEIVARDLVRDPEQAQIIISLISEESEPVE